ncbi:hypothetical protein M885DRAFT_516071 [Pelagophyceae sp. CCMP2097]|nr:hypothetical protein M885DRAFT_516071 [Pelagophyceae sp. CCMP2097]
MGTGASVASNLVPEPARKKLAKFRTERGLSDAALADATELLFDLKGTAQKTLEISPEDAHILSYLVVRAAPPGLVTLVIRNNKIGDAGAATLGLMLAQNRTITALDLNRNGIGERGCCALAGGLKRNATLLRLDVGTAHKGDAALLRLGCEFNRAGNAGALALAAALKVNVVLRVLDLTGDNSLTDEIAVCSLCQTFASGVRVRGAVWNSGNRGALGSLGSFGSWPPSPKVDFKPDFKSAARRSFDVDSRRHTLNGDSAPSMRRARRRSAATFSTKFSLSEAASTAAASRTFSADRCAALDDYEWPTCGGPLLVSPRTSRSFSSSAEYESQNNAQVVDLYPRTSMLLRTAAATDDEDDLDYRDSFASMWCGDTGEVDSDAPTMDEMLDEIFKASPRRRSSGSSELEVLEEVPSCGDGSTEPPPKSLDAGLLARGSTPLGQSSRHATRRASFDKNRRPSFDENRATLYGD